MTYRTVADMAEDGYLGRRITAGVAKEGIADPPGWSYDNRWAVVSAPGWDAAWDSALAGGIVVPGNDETVITDGMILSSIQAVLADLAPDPTVEIQAARLVFNRAQALTAATEFLPLQTLVLEHAGVEQGQPWRQPVDALHSYPRNWEVTHNGDTWQSNRRANIWEPGDEGWDVV